MIKHPGTAGRHFRRDKVDNPTWDISGAMQTYIRQNLLLHDGVSNRIPKVPHREQPAALAFSNRAKTGADLNAFRREGGQRMVQRYEKEF